MCKGHWASWKRTGVMPTGPLQSYGQSCSVPGCPRPHKAKGWCEFHGDRVKATGNPFRPGERYRPPRKSVVSIRAVHFRLEADRGKATEHSCTHCGRQADDWAYDWADPYALVSPGGSYYSLDQNHYLPLCTSCHLIFDRPHRRRP